MNDPSVQNPYSSPSPVESDELVRGGQKHIWEQREFEVAVELMPKALWMLGKTNIILDGQIGNLGLSLESLSGCSVPLQRLDSFTGCPSTT